MNCTEMYSEIIDFINHKKYKREKMRPYEEGYNEGLEKVEEILTNMYQKKDFEYRFVVDTLLRERTNTPFLSTGFNRVEGYEQAFLRCCSKLKEIYGRKR